MLAMSRKTHLPLSILVFVKLSDLNENSNDRSDVYFKYLSKMKYALQVDRRKYNDVASFFSNYKDANELPIRQFAGQLRKSADIICAPHEKSH